MAAIRLYHGTAHGFGAFDDAFARRGTEPNSALGIHLTESPSLAADYAEMTSRDRGAGAPRVVVDVDAAKVGIVVTRSDFLGREDDLPLETARPWSDFVAARLRLSDEGFHAVVGDGIGDDLDGCWVVFDPGRIAVVGTMGVETARLLDDDILVVAPDGLEYASVTLHEDGCDDAPRP